LYENLINNNNLTNFFNSSSASQLYPNLNIKNITNYVLNKCSFNIPFNSTYSLKLEVYFDINKDDKDPDKNFNNYINKLKFPSSLMIFFTSSVVNLNSFFIAGIILGIFCFAVSKYFLFLNNFCNNFFRQCVLSLLYFYTT